MNSPSNIQGDAPFNRSNYRLIYSPEEQAYVREFSSHWIKTKGLMATLIGGGVTYSLLITGKLSPSYRGLKILAGSFGSFLFTRSFAVTQLKNELKEKFPDGYVAQMHYLKRHEEAFNDYIKYAQQHKSMIMTPGGGRYVPPGQPQSYPPPGQPQSYPPPKPRGPVQPSQPAAPPPVAPPPITSSDSPQAPQGLDDRFRPQIDGLNQGKSPYQEDEKVGKPTGSYAMWRQQSGPPRQGAQPSLYSPSADTYSAPPTPSEYDKAPPPSPQQSPLRRPTSQDSQAPRKPVRRNQYGDVIEE